MSSGYDFGSLYGRADNSNLLYDEGTYDAVVEHAEWGRTKDGTKGQWTIKARTTTGPNAGRMPLTQTITVSHDNERSLGIMFRHLAALGIPVPDPQNPQVCVNGTQPFWVMGWNEQQVAQAMIGKPVTIAIKHDEYDGVTRNKIKDWRPPRPNAPTTWPQTQPGQPNPLAGFASPAPGYAAPPQPGFAPQGWGAQPGQMQPGMGGAWNPQAAEQYPTQMPGQVVPGQVPVMPPAPGQAPWQQPQPQQQQYPDNSGAATPAPQPQQMPGVPPWAQPPAPGQGGMGEFTPQGQSWQPSHMAPPQGPPAPPPGFQAPGQAQPGQIPQAPWQGQPQPQPQQQQQQQQQPPPGHAPPPPPWAQ